MFNTVGGSALRATPLLGDITPGPFGDPQAAFQVLGVAVGIVVAFFILIWFIGRWLVICRPNEIVVISGRQHKLTDGSKVGYQVLHGGRGFAIPMLEEVNRMDMRLVPVQVEVQNAYSRGGIPLMVHAIANVKVSSNPNFVRNAIERSLNMTPHQIAGIAQQTLEGVLREVVAELTPEEVNEDRLKFANTLIRNATDDFDKLGLELDVLKIQMVSDDANYLNSLGRTRIAHMIRDAQNAENQANQAITEAQASARRRAETAQKQAEAQVLTKQNQLRAELAQLEAQAKSVENEAAVAAETARAEAEQALQALRADLERLRLECDVYLPAEAQRLASEAEARGRAAPVIESGKASAEALAMVAAEWQKAGPDGRDLYVLQHLRSLVEAAVARVTRAKIGELSVVDGGDGHSFTGAVASFPAAVSEVLKETGSAIGVDIDQLLRGKSKALPGKGGV
ncbi:MAG: flotillin family protein [Polyangiaceae bacterium]